MSRFRIERRGVAWLELLFLFAVVTLVFQAVPSLWTGILWAVDIRNWSRSTWFAVNLVFVVALVAIRFGPDLYEEWRRRQERRAEARAKQRKQKELQEHRQMLERLQRGRAHRIY
jgi:hypothetical protein